MENLLFELNNEQRRCLGLIPVQKYWELIRLKDMFLYFDGDIIRKRIIVDNNKYFEQELCERTIENRTILLPKTAKGKPKKLNFTAAQSFSTFGVYFSFSSEYLRIANYTTQKTYFSEKFEDAKLIEDLAYWLDEWVEDSTEKDLEEIEIFKNAKRQHHKYKEGDFFAFKINRRKWGFGRILIDVAELRKSKEFTQNKNYGFNNLMGKSLIVKVYHKISDTLNVDLEELAKLKSLPPQAIMDNHFYYGDNVIVGNKELDSSEYDDPIISYSRSIDVNDSQTVYLQYGLIYKETNISKINKYLIGEQILHGYEEGSYRNESVGFNLKIHNLEQCVSQNSNDPFWNSKNYTVNKVDLRNPANIEIKRVIFDFYGLDADKSYEENLNKKAKSKFNLIKSVFKRKK